ncbi:hypothetical protein [Micromonospora sp. NPDC047730]|uniref:hypothetical protein n=1 Tax=Micromonospora sp. NPDC047730 TaxID=3364253 RepID=UPI00371FA3E0
MARITDEMVSEMNDRIAQAPTTAQAFRLAMGVSDRMLWLLLDLNHINQDEVGLGRGGREALAVEAHGWHLYYRDDDTPADGYGPCELGGFEAHSLRPWECRGCKRRPIDHRRVPVAVR